MRIPCIAALLALSAAPPLAAQETQKSDSAAVHADSAAARAVTVGSRRTPLLTRKDVWAGGALLGATGALSLADVRVLRAFRDPERQANARYQSVAGNLRHVQEKSLFVLSVASYGVGRLTRADAVADAGLHAAEGLALASAVSSLVKSVAGRARPFVDESDQYRFRPFKGFSDGRYRSFPSLHEGGSFAFAAVVSEEVARRRPALGHYVVAPLLYGGAAAVGASRIYSNKHWASDVLAGATIGTMSGLVVMRFNHARPAGEHSRLDRALLRHVSVVPSPAGGAALAIGGSF
ncbi:MAG TPA: phosphatase PAP2 family protein [Gemmatimonadaceae bacterium]|nr:phosphatase PAP2 family protein [Gemmatimonadaceae bacterium]